MKNKQLKIESWLPIFPGFYGSIFDNEDETYEIISENGDDLLEDWDKYEFNDELWREDTAEQCVDYINEILKKEYNIEVVYQNIVSPKFYSFSNDSINVKYILTQEIFDNLIKELLEEEEFADYIKENYSSYDGFTSFHPNDYKEFLLYLSKGDVSHKFGAIIDYILTVREEITQFDMYEELEVYLQYKKKEDVKE